MRYQNLNMNTTYLINEHYIIQLLLFIVCSEKRLLIKQNENNMNANASISIRMCGATNLNL